MKKQMIFVALIMALFMAVPFFASADSVTLHPYTLSLLDEPFEGLYTGEMRDEVPDGYGIFVVTLPEEGRSWHYIGSWKDGLMDGEGATYWENGSMEIGTYKNGRLILGYFNYDGIRLKVYNEETDNSLSPLK